MINIGIGIPFGQRSAGIDPQAKIAFDSLQSAGFTTPQGITGINAAFKTIKTIYGTSDITTAISFFGDPSLAYQIGAGSGTTLGQAIRTLPNIIDPTRATDAVQTTAASQPLLLVHEGVNYWFGSGVANNFVSTPNAVANQLTDDIGISSGLISNALSGSRVIAGKFSGVNSTSAYIFYFSGANLRLDLYQGSTANVYTSTTTVPFSANQLYYVRFSRNGTTGDIKFFTSPDEITWTQLGATVSGVTGALNNPSRILEVGSIISGASLNFNGKIYNVKLFKDDSFTTATQIFNPNQYNPSTSQTQWTSSTGEVWSINTANTVNALKGALVDRTYIMGNGTSMGLRAASLNVNRAAITSYTAFRKYNVSAGGQMVNELGTGTNQGKYLFLPINPNREEFAITANVGTYNGQYIDSNINLKLATYINNIANANEASPYLINNVSQTFATSTVTANNTVAMNATGYNLLARNNASSLFCNALLSCDIIANQEDNSTQRTAMYNYIRSINNAAF